MNHTVPQNAVYRVFTVPWIFNDGTYGFKDMPCWVIETPRMDYAEYTEKGTKPMTLNEELTNLYKVANDKKAKSREFLEHTLPDRLRACANEGFNCYTIPFAEIEVNGLTLFDIRSWCIANGLFCDSLTSLSGEYVSIYWAIHRE